MKYFCVSEAVVYYLQNYVVYRKRKIFHGKQTFNDLIQIINKHNSEKFLVPCSDIQRKNIPDLLEKNNINFQNAVLYKTVCSDLSDYLMSNTIFLFFIALRYTIFNQEFPEFEQTTKIAALDQQQQKQQN